MIGNSLHVLKATLISTDQNAMSCICVLALVWQLMKAYTLSILTKLAGQDAGHPIVEKEIVAWVNEKVEHLKTC